MRRRRMLPLAALGLACGACLADEPASLGEELRAGFFSRVNVFGFALHQEPAETFVNTINVLGTPRTQKELDLRPDFNLKWRQLELDLKPRFQWSRTRTLYADLLQFDTRQDRAYINEGSVRYRLHDRLILSYGRENLQWGPSALLSPSNPFNASNGRNNPNLELPGLDYARVVYVASSSLTISLISNTGRGRLDQVNRYRKANAAKVDYTGDGYFLSLVVSRGDGEETRVGGFAGWDVSESVSLHAEGSAARREESLLPQRRDRQLLVGASYTFEQGAKLSAEYFYRDDGCIRLSIQACLALRGALVDPVRPLVRRRYAMLQYADTRIAGKLNLAARLVRNLDDKSSQLVVNLEYELGDHWQLYAIPTFYHGSRTSEFGSLLRKSIFVGASYTF
ncbi:hypothetical protein [Massilia niastensis]|uniref:hypothetical protein n=1 Tax=Massilia niastensis TaxID=544911 RepID=UPI0012ECAAC1|nr:hypothetical protein [Massilia niastensis]